jgi:hypothetical protein
MFETFQLLAGRWGHTVQLEATRYLAGAVGGAILYWLLRHWIEPRRIQDRSATPANRHRELGHQIARNAIGHSGHELAWSGVTRSRWTGRLATTTHRDLHRVEGRYNFGLYFTWWDRMMGTEHPHYHARFESVAARALTPGGAATA